MSHYAEPQSAGPTSGSYKYPSAWVGWIAFAGVIMVMLGTFHIIEGLVALFNDDYFVVGKSGLVVNVGFTAWGWAHLIGGVIVLVAGLCVFGGQIWARAAGTVLALVSAVLNLAFLSAYPFWSLIMIGLAVVVILALTVHGSDIKPGALPQHGLPVDTAHSWQAPRPQRVRRNGHSAPSVAVRGPRMGRGCW